VARVPTTVEFESDPVAT